MIDKDRIGDGRAQAAAADIRAALAPGRRARVPLWPIAGGLAWAR
ncbi:hypothetical protein [Novosphingobium album (ex Liu et al. 2023)]|uniref:Uncharacterized protein n=1 Tax=Novosphingobium album (ex Liu et al. 2023) TaxID=3031130 RepID=A0ABT5WSG4_9SPHN|nr:hypothetical protein [Novosphingobium album (ex Liu et al. 2023)]MDE8652988.1 hypothetical protein [Novosphingobium album (ex Liu et al. 2023)]